MTRANTLLAAALLFFAACKKEPPAPVSNPASRTLEHKYGDTIPLTALRPGDTLKYPNFSLSYRGLRSKAGEPAILARHIFATTNAQGKTVELSVVNGTSVALQVGGSFYRIDTRGGSLKVGNL